MIIDLTGQRVIITGAGGGVGRALVKVFASSGASIVACDLSEECLSGLDVAAQLSFDLSCPDQTRSAADTINSGGAPSIVISNAGWSRAETLQDLDSQALQRELDINLHGCITLCRSLLPAMRKSRRGSFVFVSSVNALAHFGNPAYSVAKAGVLAWMRAIAAEEGRYGIRANAVVPGSIETDAWSHRIEKDPDIVDRVNRLYPLGRMVTPDEVARAVAFLASDCSSGISGVSLPVDAGLMSSNLPFLDHIP